MGYNPSYKWINPTYPIYNWGYNPLTKWDEPPSTIFIYLLAKPDTLSSKYLADRRGIYNQNLPWDGYNNVDSKVLDGVSVVRLVPQKKEVGQGNQAQGWPLISQVVGPVALWVRCCFFSQGWNANSGGSTPPRSALLFFFYPILCFFYLVSNKEVSFPLSLSFSLFCFLVVVLSHCFVFGFYFTLCLSLLLFCLVSFFCLWSLWYRFFFLLLSRVHCFGFVSCCLSLSAD